MASNINSNLFYSTPNQERLYLEMKKKEKTISHTQPSIEQTNADKLSLLITNAYEVFNQTKTFFTEFCKAENLDFSAKFEKATADQQLSETSDAVNEYVNQIIGQNHGFTQPKAAVWKNEKVSIREILEVVKARATDSIVQGSEKLGCRVVEKKVQLTYVDKDSKEVRTPDSSHVDCLLYALYRLRDVKAEESIFLQKPIFSGRSCGAKLEVLMDQLGYRLVETAQWADFIVYLNKKGNLCHGGVMVGPDTVQSKWGGKTDEVIEHSIGCVPEPFRYSYILLRKDGSRLDTPWIR